MKRVSSATPGHPKVSREATRKCFLGLVNTWRGTQASWQQSMHPFVSWQGIKKTFLFGPEHDHAFRAVRREISSMSVQRYFDPRADTTIQTDASQKKGWEMPSYKTSSQYATFQGHLAEQNYSNIERETLGGGVGAREFPSLHLWKTLLPTHRPLTPWVHL